MSESSKFLLNEKGNIDRVTTDDGRTYRIESTLSVEAAENAHAAAEESRRQTEDAAKAESLRSSEFSKIKGEVSGARISVGTVSSGESAAASIDGGPWDWELSLTLPRGPKGDKGDPGDAFSEGTVVSIAQGGTGATSAEQALANLGASASSHKHSASDLTSGALPVSRGGTGATAAAQAAANLGLSNGVTGKWRWHKFANGGYVATQELSMTFPANNASTAQALSLPFAAPGWDRYGVQLTLVNDQGAQVPNFNRIGLVAHSFTANGFRVHGWNDSGEQVTYRVSVTVVCN